MSALFKNGVRWYTTATATVKVGFPEGKVCCQWCRFCKAETAMNRYKCLLTERMVYDPFYMGLPDGCPLSIDTDKNTEEEF